MKNKGFTLIELLAVIVILAIIALIATPIILNIINDSKEESNKRSIDMYAKAIENAVAKEQLADPTKLLSDRYDVSEENVRELVGSEGTKLTIEYDGEVVVCKDIKLYEDGSIYLAECSINGELIDYEYGELPKYNNGQVIYLDIETGNSCANYHEDNSKTGYNGKNGEGNQNSCLKFYAFNDNGGKNLNLLLDHNTTAKVAWTNSSTSKNENGPIDVINKLEADTSSWNVPTISKNYTYKKYTINYRDRNFKARLIEAQEIAQITGADKDDTLNWKEESSDELYYFDSLTDDASKTCKSGNITGCKFGWLYDRASTSCTRFGCLNNSDIQTYGYWTSSAHAVNSNNAWIVYLSGELVAYNDVSTYYIHKGTNFGVRPVIEVSKLNL